MLSIRDIEEYEDWKPIETIHDPKTNLNEVVDRAVRMCLHRGFMIHSDEWNRIHEKDWEHDEDGNRLDDKEGYTQVIALTFYKHTDTKPNDMKRKYSFMDVHMEKTSKHKFDVHIILCYGPKGINVDMARTLENDLNIEKFENTMDNAIDIINDKSLHAHKLDDIEEKKETNKEEEKEKKETKKAFQSDLIILLSSKPINGLSLERIRTWNIDTEAFSTEDLQFCGPSHAWCSSSFPLSEQQIRFIEHKYKPERKYFTRIRRDDAYCKYFGCKKGDVIFCVRRSGVQPAYESIRIVV